MTVEFDKSFLKSIKTIDNQIILNRLGKIILRVEKASSLSELKNIRKLSGFESYYRIRMGDYRIGFELLSGNIIRFIIVAHRKDIYRDFP